MYRHISGQCLASNDNGRLKHCIWYTAAAGCLFPLGLSALSDKIDHCFHHSDASVLFLSLMQRHSFTALNSTFVVDSEYQFVKELGQGAYGCVVAARHRRSGEGCAIKKITNINTKAKLLSNV